jgi:hypothetical protein
LTKNKRIVLGGGYDNGSQVRTDKGTLFCCKSKSSDGKIYFGRNKGENCKQRERCDYLNVLSDIKYPFLCKDPDALPKTTDPKTGESIIETIDENYIGNDYEEVKTIGDCKFQQSTLAKVSKPGALVAKGVGRVGYFGFTGR